MAKGKLYSTNQIGVGCFFGTPFASLVMMAINYKTFDNLRKCKNTYAISLLILPLVTYMVNQMVERNGYRIFAFLLSGLMMLIAERLQGADYKKHIQDGGLTKSYWKVVSVILTSIMLIFLGSIAYIAIGETLGITV